jgi:hypothetical protein
MPQPGESVHSPKFNKVKGNPLQVVGQFEKINFSRFL